MVHLVRVGNLVQIVFTEAKLFSNTTSLRADPARGKLAKIFQQIEDYESYIKLHERAIRDAYHQACRHLIAIRTLQGVPVDPLLRDAAGNVDLITVEHQPRLLIFRTDKDKAMHESALGSASSKYSRAIKSCEIVPASG